MGSRSHCRLGHRTSDRRSVWVVKEATGEAVVARADPIYPIGQRGSKMETHGQEPSERLGPFRVTGVLGRGGMGIVYEGVHVEGKGRFALKTVRVPHHQYLVALRREVRALSRLRHPRVIEIVDHGVEAGMPWYAMPLLTGSTLADLIAKGRTPDFTSTRALVSLLHPSLDPTLPAGPKEEPDVLESEPRPIKPTDLGALIRVIRQVCEGLAYLHSNGFVHRDLKPANVFVTESLSPIIVDFGVATSFAGSEGTESLDAVVQVGGTANYMSPEQILGEFVDARSDLYSLGCILYECLTGRLPFSGKSQWNVISGHLYTRPRRPSHFCPDTPKDLEALTLGLLAKLPHERIGHADLVERVLANFLGEKAPLTPTPPQSTYLYRPNFISCSRLQDTTRDLLGRLSDGEGGVLLLGGESGAGKTRTAMEVAAYAHRSKLTVAVGSCVPLANSSPRDAVLAAFRPALHLVADSCREGGPSLVEEVLGKRAEDLASVDDLFAAFIEKRRGPRQALPPDRQRRRLVQALRATLHAFAQRRPLLIILDDLQWADDLSLALLEELCVNDATRIPLLIVATHRVEEAPERLRHLTQQASVRRYEIRPFDQQEVRKLVAGLLGLDDVPQALFEYVSSRSEGNPFFASEYLRSQIESGVLSRNSLGQWTLSPDVSVEQLTQTERPPERIHDLFQRRVNQLEHCAKHLVTVAAILGRDLQPEWLRLSAELTDDAFLDAVQTLRTKQILTDKQDGLLSFCHDQIRTIIYESTADDVKPLLHKKAAEVIESVTMGHTIPTAVLAHHWDEAKHPDRASVYWRRAGDDVQATFANHDAIRYFVRALSAAELVLAKEPSDPARWRKEAREIAEKLGDCEALAATFPEAKVSYQRALFDFGTLAPVASARVHRKRAKVLTASREHEHAQEEYDGALAALDSVAPQKRNDEWWTEWIELQIERAWAYYWKAQLSELMSLIMESKERVRRHGNSAQRARLLHCLLNARMRAQRYRLDDAALDLAREAHAEGECSQDISVRCETRFGLAFALLFAGRLDEAAKEFQATVEEAIALGDTPIIVRSLTYLSVVERRRGSLTECEAVSRNVLEMATSAQMTDYLGAAHGSLAWIAWRQNDLSRVQRHGQSAIEAWQRPPATYPFQWLALWPLAAEAEARGDLMRARHYLIALLDPTQQRLPKELEEAVTELSRQEGENARADPQSIQYILSHAGRSGEL